MRPARAAPVAVLAVVLLVLLLPGTLATRSLTGTVTTCASSSSCTFSFNTSAGTGWASATPPLLSFQLPGEAKASYNLSYSTYIAKLTGTYTYWTVGSFWGTDVNTGHVVYGTTNTNYTITCVGHSGRGGGCTYVDTTDNGSIVFKFTTAEQTSTAVTCSPSSVNAGASSKCTVTVADLWNASNVPTGRVHFSNAGYGTFSNRGSCNLTAGSCALTFHAGDNSAGTATISASYAGTTSFYKSAGSTTVSITGGG